MPDDLTRTHELTYFCGVSWPRSGHHLLVRILQKYFGDRFGYCEYYTPTDCCKSVPCERAGVTLSKNHDRESNVPILNGGRYLIQYREFCPSVVSDFELYARNTRKDSAKSFRRLAEKRVENYLRFMDRWATAHDTNANFIRISYERLTKVPAEAIGPIIDSLAPDELLDRVRLLSSIESAERITVKNGIEVPDGTLGVNARRNVTTFRYYDEDLFSRYDQLTKSAYERMAALPAVCRDSGYSDGSNVRTVRLRSIILEHSRIYVDVTGQLSQIGIAPTGIPRVEEFIARQAINDPDPEVQVVTYDRGIGAYRRLTDDERSLLVAGFKIKLNPESARCWRHSLCDAIATVNRNPNLRKDSDRYHAARISGKGPRDFRHKAAKNFIRAYRLIRSAQNKVRGQSIDIRSKIDPKSGNFLISQTALFSSLFEKTMLATTHRAFICHDLIPWLHPEFASDKRQADRFVAHLTLLVKSGARALCTSDLSRTILSNFVDEIGTSKIRIDRFPLPSMLFEMTSPTESVSRQSQERPYIVYCSTIEARKNHMLLAKVWKRSLDEGAPLPKLVCAGKWGWGVEELRTYLRENPGVNDSIEFLGPVSDQELVELYRNALFGVVPSRIEGWGLGASECLDFGIPVIVSTAPALLEATRGLMPAIGADDVEAWYREIRHLSECQTDREVLTERIAAEYRPVTDSESWQVIKSAFTSN